MSGFSSNKTASFPNSTNTKRGKKRKAVLESCSEVLHATFQGEEDPSGKLTQ